MRGLLAAIPFVFAVFAAAQDPVGSAKDAPARITPEMKAKTETIARALEGLTPEGFTKKGLVERYTEANLYEKIDGRSELFHAYDVTGMTFVTFSKADDPAKFIDVFLYDMTTSLGAFGVYSVERSSGSKAIATGDGGHRTGADLFFRKGQYYASILTSGPDQEVQKAVSALALTLANRLKGEAAKLWGLAMLPAKNRIDDTVQYLMVDALGLDFLTNAFMAKYRDGEAEFTGFVRAANQRITPRKSWPSTRPTSKNSATWPNRPKSKGRRSCSPRWAAATSTAPARSATSSPGSRRSRAATRPSRP